ncbi:hypothetical protein F5882DRAFT_87496 [Hyaloscypha sp. PMI_1271]|nr:hypothetical protein F5882DRAFT_87496 [Hyaloscypha sp. PMI_1271]
MAPIQSPDMPHRRPRFLPSRHKPAPSQILHSRLQEPGHTQRTLPAPSALAYSTESRQFRRPRSQSCSKQIREVPFLISSLFRNFAHLHNSTDRKSSATTTSNLAFKTSSTTQYPNFNMSFDWESTLQASQGDEFFDFAAASGEFYDTGPSSAAQTWATSSPPFNEALHNFPTSDNNHGVPSYSSFQAGNNLAGDTTAWAEMGSALHQHQSINNMAAATFNLPEEANVWAPDSSISPTKAFQLGSSAPTETQDRLRCDPLTPTALGSSQWHMDDQQFQNSSMMGPALPSEGNQSE